MPNVDPEGIIATIPMPDEQSIIQSLALATIPTYGETSLTLRRWEYSTAVTCLCLKSALTHIICHLSYKGRKYPGYAQIIMSFGSLLN